ncbi:hypothetical protein [Streptomyces sp. NPDC047046]|uniref:hypothetical protein n=1 Tax=Streptomyces sp. NPDC047046 TaxID=3155378 RepID=UPI0033BFE30E
MAESGDTRELAVLRAEFAAEEGSFLLGLHEGEWDATGFRRLEHAMRVACAHTQGAPLLERWLAEGFHLIPREVRAKASCLRRPPHDTAGLCDRLDDLSLCFFLGEPPG